MSETPSSSSQTPQASNTAANLRGAVDLSAVASSTASAAKGLGENSRGNSAPGSNAQGNYVLGATEQNFTDLVQLSVQAPVVLGIYAQFSPQSVQLIETLSQVVNSYAGKLLLATVDMEAFPQLAQALEVQGVPAVIALLTGQPVPLFNGTLGEAEIRRYLDELLKVAAQNGVSGTLDGVPGQEETAEEEKPLPPQHQEALAAIERGDYQAAVSAYQAALAESPADADAKAGLAQVHLLQRTEWLDAEKAQQARQQAAQSPEDLKAQLTVADLDMVGGHVEDSFQRLIRFIADHPTDTDGREEARKRLVDLFEVTGLTDPRVVTARRELSRVLF